METLKRLGKWALYGLFALYAIPAVFMAISQPNGGAGVWIPVGSVVLIAGAIVLRRAGLKGKETRISAMADEATAWAAALNTGTAPAIDTMGLITPRGETAYLCERSELAEIVTRRRAGYAGTRVKVGAFPVYLGGSESVSRKEMTHSDSGTAMLTDRSLLFVGSSRTIAFALRDVIQARPALDAITINVQGRQTPVTIAVRNPLLWSAAISALATAK